MHIARVVHSALSALAISIAVPANGAAQASTTPATIHSTVFFADSGVVRETSGGGKSRAIVDAPTTNFAKLEMHETTLAPGKAPHAGHRHLHEEMMIMRTGTVSVQLGDREFIAKPGDVVFAASNEFHGWKNAGSDTATYLVIRIDTPAVAAAAAAAAKKP